jgi:hypothetical protein
MLDMLVKNAIEIRFTFQSKTAGDKVVNSLIRRLSNSLSHVEESMAGHMGIMEFIKS